MRCAAKPPVGLCLVLLAASWSFAAEPAKIPELALRAMEFRVGKWESIGFVDGAKQPKPGIEVTEWVAGKYAIRLVSSFEEDGKEMHGSGLIGWDRERQQLVEHWYTADGSYATFCYTLDDDKRAGIGTFKWTYGDGRTFEGESVVQMKSDDEWEWNASYVVDGQKHTWRTISRRVR